jgi:hypothetical protein
MFINVFLIYTAICNPELDPPVIDAEFVWRDEAR